MTQDGEISSPSPDERSLASLAHALQIVGWFLAPLIIFLVRRDSKFVSFHALQALLLQVVSMLVFGVMMVVMVASFIVPIMRSENQRRSEPAPEAVEHSAEESPSDDKANDTSKAEPAKPEAPKRKSAGRKNEAPPLWFFIAFPVFWLFHMGAWVLILVMAIVYCIKASRGEWAAYPIIGRWAKRLLQLPLDP